MSKRGIAYSTSAITNVLINKLHLSIKRDSK